MTGYRAGKSKRERRLAEIRRLREASLADTQGSSDWCSLEAALTVLEDREAQVRHRYSRMVARHQAAAAETDSRLQCVSILESLVDELRVGRLPVPQEAQEAIAALCRLLGKGALPGASLAFRQRIIFAHNGDASVGVEGERAEVLVDTSGFSPSDAAERVAAIREAVSEALGKVWEFPVWSVTDGELFDRQSMGRGSQQIRRLNAGGYSVKGMIGGNGNFRWFVMKEGEKGPAPFPGNAEGWRSYGEALDRGTKHLLVVTPTAKPKARDFTL